VANAVAITYSIQFMIHRSNQMIHDSYVLIVVTSGYNRTIRMAGYFKQYCYLLDLSQYFNKRRIKTFTKMSNQQHKEAHNIAIP
ncbi:MAG: hypothetical protein WAL66_12235, partial [Nitrososphaeraceae archaeon]